jgi:hypothetical protein
MIGIEKVGMFVDDPETFVDTSLYRGGEKGLVFNPPGDDGLYQLVKLDSTADAAGVAKDVVYWLSPSAATITTTIGESESATGNSMAGVITVALPTSSYAFVKLRGAQSTKANSGTKGVMSVPHTGSNQVTDNVDVAPELLIRAGVCTVAAGGGFATIRLQLNPV